MSGLLLLAATGITPVRADEGESIGLKVPPGFTITRFADDSLAHDIFSMTTDTAGRVVVSGQGYVRILIDDDGDGKADRAKEFVDGPRSGAQGLYFYGRDLLCTGDGGLIRYKDEDGDDRADGPPEMFLKVKTGSEHHSHAIRRGPDGWWYLIAGNFAEVTGGHATEKNSPIRAPHGGVIMRLKPDLSGGEIVCDGFRNAYDFDFNANGELFAYDSDGERDVSLPWYLPTRLFHVLPGGEHGWITESWKRPDYLFDSAPVVSATGRGSPTGVLCYRHTQFPERYRGALFILDWTFGRVLTVPLVRAGGTFAPRQATDFITAEGQTGFAPTDIDMGIDGSLYVCVGGRGTHGTVYRITYTGPDVPPGADLRPAILTVNERSSPEQKLAACLEAPQPLCSWSRARWVPLANRLGSQAFLSVALDEQQPAAARIRAIEILVDVFSGIPSTAAEILATARSPELRARAVWSLGVNSPQEFPPEVLLPYLNDADAIVRRRALETLARVPGNPAALLPSVARCLNDNDRQVRLAAARLIPGMKPAPFKELADTARKISWKAALTTAVGYVWRSQLQNQAFNAYAVDLGRRVLDGKHSLEMKLEAVRLLQMAIGDLSGREETVAVFEGYTSILDLSDHERELDPLRISVAKLFPTGNRLLDLELGRLAAMLVPVNDELFNKLLDKVQDGSSPVDDIHYLICAARLPIEHGPAQRDTVARALLDLDRKIARDKLQQDSNWNDRIGELYTAFVAHDAGLPPHLVSLPGFGRPGHVIFVPKLTEQQLPPAIEAFRKAVTADPDYPWNNDVVYIIGYGKTPEHYALVRQQFEKFDLRMAVLMVLAQKPVEEDRDKFAAGLDSAPIEILNTCVSVLEFLPAKDEPVGMTALVKLLRRLGSGEKTEFALRERVVKLLERNSGEKFDFIFGTAGYLPQAESVEKWTEWVTRKYPEEAARQLGGGGADLTALRARLAAIDWESADIERGRKLFSSRGCAQCHGGGKGLGPDLAGVTGRFSRDDLFIAIALPNRDVSPRYQTTLVETKAGKVYTGLIVYESVEGLLLRNGTNQTFRIDAPDIESQRNLPTSLMPEGLLKDLADQDLADLYAYLRTLAARTAALDPDEEDDETQTE
jgi:putative membrane-bound dehydrogenase-like protein